MQPDHPAILRVDLFAELPCLRVVPAMHPLRNEAFQGDGDDAYLQHPFHTIIVCRRGRITSGVDQPVHLVSLPDRVDGGVCEAHAGPQAGDDQFLPVGLFERVPSPLVLERVEAGDLAGEHFLVRENGRQLRDDLTVRLGIDGRQER